MTSFYPLADKKKKNIYSPGAPKVSIWGRGGSDSTLCLDCVSSSDAPQTLRPGYASTSPQALAQLVGLESLAVGPGSGFLLSAR